MAVSQGSFTSRVVAAFAMWSRALTERRSMAGEENSIIVEVAKVANKFMDDKSVLCLVGELKSDPFLKVVKRSQKHTYIIYMLQ
jgi:hypothetical protein